MFWANANRRAVFGFYRDRYDGLRPTHPDRRRFCSAAPADGRATVEAARHQGRTRARSNGKVPREEFIPMDARADAYEDGPLPIGYDQTISQPYVVAFMTEQLRPKQSDRVLEIGSGSGYQAAILGELVAEIYTIEIVEPLAKSAEATLQRLGYNNVHIKVGDGYKGWPEEAPFDAIIVTCAPEKIPQPLVDQLKDGGRMVIPVGERFAQQLYLLEKKNGQLKESVTLPVRFVPMLREAPKK
jgi:protein-L-isoaspartate(D-aspartate) O-methyltransferase